jgi:hypothetical protein
MKDLSEMTVDELEDLLASLRDDLEDLEEERAFVLGQTGVHLSVSAVTRYEVERRSLKEKIEEVEAALRTRPGERP